MNTILLEKTASVAYITLNQPQLHNAFEPSMLEELLEAFHDIESSPHLRVLVLKAEGKSFSAGANLHWMQQMKHYTLEENKQDARLLGKVMHALYTLKKPTLAVIQGPALGGGVGLAACCDIRICSTEAYFCLSETKLGLIPAVISPYVINAMGENYARRYYLTAEKIDAFTAHRIGFVHECVEPQALIHTEEELLGHLLQNSPHALGEAKALIEATSRSPINEALVEDTVKRIANIRISEEGQEGLAAFLEKRSPSWCQKSPTKRNS